MSILIISAIFPPEPTVSGKLCHDVAEFLFEKKFPLKVLTPRPSRPYGFQFEGAAKRFEFDHSYLKSFVYPKSGLLGRIRESYSLGKKSASYINNHKDDITLIYANTWPLFAQYFLVKAAKKHNIPVVIHVQDVYPESFSNKIPVIGSFINTVLLPIDKFTLRNATKVIAISDKMKKYLMETRIIADEKVFMIPNWQDEKRFLEYKSMNGIPEKKDIFTFMYLGNIGPVAGIDSIIEAFHRAQLKECRLIIAGGGSMKETYQKKVAELNLDSVEFWSVGEGEVPKIQAQADVMLLPVKKGAASSSIPSKLPAYMFSEKPVIASVDQDSDTAEAIISSDCGWVLPPENPDNLSDFMRMVVSLPKEELQKKGRNGFEYAIKYFSKGENLEKLAGIIVKEFKSGSI